MSLKKVLGNTTHILDDINRFVTTLEADPILVSLSYHEYYEDESNFLTYDLGTNISKLSKLNYALTEYDKIVAMQYVADPAGLYDTMLSGCQQLLDSLPNTQRILQSIKEKPSDEHPPFVCDLLSKLTDFFQLIDQMMETCRKGKAHEERYRQTPILCLKAFRNAYEDELCRCASLIPSFLAPNSKLPESQMVNDLKGASPGEQFIVQGFHRYTPSDFIGFVIYDRVQQHKRQGLTEEENQLWPDDHQMARKTRYLIEHFDELGVEGKYESSKHTHHIHAKYISMLMRWSGTLATASTAAFLHYFRLTYHGKLLAPAGSSGVNGLKSKWSQEEYDQFAKRADQLVSDMEKKEQKTATGSNLAM